MMHTHSWTASNIDLLGNLFGRYKNVSQIRNIILQLDAADVSEAFKQNYKGELKALR